MSVTIEHGQKQEVGSRRQSVPGCVSSEGPVRRLVHGNVERDRILHPPQQGAQEGSIRDEHHSNRRTGREFLRVQGIQELRSRRRGSVHLEAALQVLGEDSPEGQPIKEALKKARDQCPALPIRARIEKIQADLTREQHLLQQALESLQRLRDDTNNSVLGPSPNGRPPVPMDVENPVEEVQRLRAQVAELQQERASGQETDESRAKKARILSVPTPTLDVGPVHGVVGGSSRASDVMQTLIDAAESTLKEVRNA